MHLFDAAIRFYGGNAIVAGGLPLAVGLALADAMQHRNRVTACYFGDGAVAEGAFHESLNMAALWRLPVLFCCENNLYAMGTALERAQSQTDLTAKAAAYKVPTLAVDGMDVMACHAAAQQGAGHIRATGGPVLHRVPNVSLPRALDVRPGTLPGEGRGRAVARARPDPDVQRAMSAGRHLDHRPISPRSSRRPTKELDDAVAFADAGTWESVDDLERDVLTPTREGAR